MTAGLAGVLIIVGAQVADAAGLLERRASWWRPLVSLPGHVLLLLSWWQLGPRWRRPLLTAAIWSLPMLFSLPLHSRDVYAYGATGWQVVRGIDPYTTPLGEAGMPGLLVGIDWFKTTSVYPSLSLDLFGVVSRLTGGDLYWTTVAMRLPALLALVIVALVLPALARRFGVDPRLALWAGLLNPIMLVQWVGGVHNDALMVALALAALLAVTDLGWRGWRGLLVAGVLLGTAMGIKQSAALFGLGVVAIGWSLRFPTARGWGRLTATAVVPGAVTVLTFLATSLSWGLGWRNPTAGNPVAATSNAPLSWVASFFRYHELLSAPAANSLVGAVSTVIIVIGVVVVWIKLGPRGDSVGRPWPFLAAVLVVFCVCAPALQPWYVTWLLPVYVFCGLGAAWHRAWLIVVAAMALLPPLQDLLAPYVSMALLALPLAFLWRWMNAQGFSPLPIGDDEDHGGMPQAAAAP